MRFAPLGLGLGLLHPPALHAHRTARQARSVARALAQHHLLGPEDPGRLDQVLGSGFEALQATRPGDIRGERGARRHGGEAARVRSRLGDGSTFFYYVFFALAVIVFFVLRRLYRGRFGLAINAIRDDEDKAEAMGLPTTRYKTMSWMVSAFFLGLAGGPFGLLIGFIDPRDTAFAGITFGVWMVLMAILGGKGTLWGPILGAVVFLIFKELFWIFLLGWQQVALGALIIIIVVFFPQGLMGWMREKWPEKFGHRVEETPSEGAP